MTFLIVVTAILALLQLFGVISISWFVVFIPLYPTLALTIYFLIKQHKDKKALEA